MFSQDVLARDETGQKGDPEKMDVPGTPDESLFEVEQELLGGSGDAMEADPLLEHIRTRVTDEGLIIEVFDIEGSPLFDGPTAEPNPIFEDLVQMIGRVLSRTVNPVAVTGHLATGDVGRGGPDPWRLSSDRAQLTRELPRVRPASPTRGSSRVTGKADRSPVVGRPARLAQPAGRDHAAAPLRAAETPGWSTAVSADLKPAAAKDARQTRADRSLTDKGLSMGISSSLNAGVSGLNANANKLATISDNIANSQTYGYKRADVDFSSMTVSDAKSPNTVGGGRWFTAGGVRTNAIWDVDAKGALTHDRQRHRHRDHRARLPAGQHDSPRSGSRRTTDLPFMLTTTGSFPTERRRLPAHAVGPGAARLAGGRERRRRRAAARHASTGLEPVQINLSSVAVQPTADDRRSTSTCRPTTTRRARPATARPVTVEYFDNLGARRRCRSTFTPTVPAVGDPRATPGRSTSSTRPRASRRAPTSSSSATRRRTPAGSTSGDQTAPAARSPPPTTPATGDMTLDLGNQDDHHRRRLDRAGGAAAPEPAVLDLLARSA